MYSMENYFWGIVGYLVGALVVIWYLIWLLGHMPFKTVRHLLIMLFVAILFAPLQAYTDQSFLAPAFVVMAFEGFFETGAADWKRAISPIVFVYFIQLLSYRIYQWWRHRRSSLKKTQPEPEPEIEPEAEALAYSHRRGR